MPVMVEARMQQKNKTINARILSVNLRGYHKGLRSRGTRKKYQELFDIYFQNIEEKVGRRFLTYFIYF